MFQKGSALKDIPFDQIERNERWQWGRRKYIQFDQIKHSTNQLAGLTVYQKIHIHMFQLDLVIETARVELCLFLSIL